MQPLPQLTLEHFFNDLRRASQVVLMVKSSLANTGGVRNISSIPGSGRSPEEEMATHCSILARRIPWTEEPGVLGGPWGCKALHTTAATEHQQLFYPFPDHTQLLSSTTCLLITLLAITWLIAPRHEFLYRLI